MSYLSYLFSFLKPHYVTPCSSYSAAAQNWLVKRLTSWAFIQNAKAHVKIVWALHLANSSWLLHLGLQDLLFHCHLKNQSMVQPRRGDLFWHILKHSFPNISEKSPNLELWLYLFYFIINHSIFLWKLQPKGDIRPRRENLAFCFLKYIFLSHTTQNNLNNVVWGRPLKIQRLKEWGS